MKPPKALLAVARKSCVAAAFRPVRFESPENRKFPPARCPVSGVREFCGFVWLL